MAISVVIPSHNRVGVVARAICSALDALHSIPGHEVIIVDDASNDDTVPKVRERFQSEISAGRLKIIESFSNRGVTASKNEGHLSAKNPWVVFLDSDDTLLPGIGSAMLSVLNSYNDKPLIFFRCIDERGEFVGRSFESDVVLDLKAYLRHTSYGEALTAINKRIVTYAPYVAHLRGYEGLGCCRIISRHGAAILSTLIARQYDCGGEDRLSVGEGLLSRMSLLAQGHLMLVREFWPWMPWYKAFHYLVKAAAYSILGLTYRLLKGNNR